MSIRDTLTGLYNRRYMEETLKREISRSRRKGTAIGIIMTDIDFFKKYNDTMGHDAGDALLTELGKFILKNVRDSDVACRYGGEEFIIIMPEATLNAALRRAEFLRENVKLLNTSHIGSGISSQITLSFGVAVFESGTATIEGVLKAADNALYKAKRTGRNCVVTADIMPNEPEPEA
jgi:diguanylate cyclase (GGDEF)-like protein